MEKRGFISRHLSLLLQVVVWLLITLLPMGSLILNDPSRWYLIFTWLVPVGAWMIIFYINYFLYIPRLLFKRKTKVFVGINVLTGLAMVMALEVCDMLISDHYTFKPDLQMLFGLLTLLLMFMFLVMAAISIRSLQRNRQLEQERDHTAREQSEQELARLKSQLNPHFLFNSLNNISALSAIDPEGTQAAIGSLSSMLRYVLYDTAAPLVRLSDELEFVNHYIELMRLRYTSRLTLQVTNHCHATPDSMLPPMLFISIVENAFKYGASSTLDSRITITLSEPEPGRISMRATNTIMVPAVSAPAESTRPEKRGLGLRNLRRRLELLFPDDHELTYGPNAEGLYEAVITVPLQSSHAHDKVHSSRR